MSYGRRNKGAFDGYAYVIGSVADRRVKIGSSCSPGRRLAELQPSNPNPLRILITFPGGAALERLLHDLLRRFRVSGEWFDFGDANPVIMAEDAVQNLRSEGRFPSIDELNEFLLYPKEPTLKEKVVNVMRARGAPMTADEIAVELGTIAGRLSPRLTALKHAGEIYNSDRKWYLTLEVE